MRFEAWLAGLWDGDGTKYIIKRRHRKQVDYFVKISTTSFLEVKRIIEFFDKVFKEQPYNTRAVYKENRKRFLFEPRYDNKTLFNWFSEERLNALAMKYPIDYLSGLFWAEGSIVIMVGDKLIEPYISFGVKTLNGRKNGSSPRKRVDFRLEKALEEIKKLYSNVHYRIYVRKKGKKTFILKGDVIKLILYNNPSNYRIFRLLFAEKRIGLYEYLVAYTLDTTTLNRLLGNVLNSSKRYEYSLFDKWILSNVFEITYPKQQFNHLYRLKSTERAIELYNELYIYDYRDLLRYSEKACELIKAISNEIRLKLILSALENIYANTMKHFMKLLRIFHGF